MSVSNASEKWIQAGYDLFAKEGPHGIQVERLARILHLNKSGFYHYFKDVENFYIQLMKYHRLVFDLFANDLSHCKNIDPDCLNVLLKHKTSFMAQIHLVRNKSNPFFNETHKELDEKAGRSILQLWIDHTEINYDPELAYQYYCLVRDMAYTRLEWENLTYAYLHILSDEAKEIAKKIVLEKKELRVLKSKAKV